MTTITREQARRLQEAALFTAANRNRSFTNMLTEQAPKAAKGDMKGNKQTSSGAPIVQVTDLKKTKGDTVDMQIVHKLTKRPTMGDQRIAGRGESLDFTAFELSIDQGRHQVDAGGKMSKQRTAHNLMSTSRTLLGTYYNDLKDQLATVHMAGARGDFIADDTIVPLSAHEEYAGMLVNDVLPPTYDRHFFGGDATTFETLDQADVFSMSVVDSLSLFLDEMDHPIQPIRFNEDKLAGDEPFFILNITPRQWNDFKQTSSYKDWQQLAATAMKRKGDFSHQVFRGDCVMHENILVRKYLGMPIRFNTGSTVNVAGNDNEATVRQVTASTSIDRAMLIGAQALADAWGSTSKGSQFSVHTEKTDSGNRDEVTIAWMNGLKKIRFKDKNGRMNDHGVVAVDTAISMG
ncbi:N4-gp56 family major capsid protein [Enterovibrio norvegicus FF-33]|uniref:N4-gp56 family major capsid protein n=1 Tax=Enterovibrio norvegicus TaxID=188144 RepID=UPI0002F5A127|nr:N4-gp56 family major capsid protein [Enterovibrio norvegicus]OEE65856.1 N4-gp56 family major capsid protein [Enterovibrio norvegicus FF-33]